MAKSDTYFEAVGRRKTAIARVRITPASKTSVVINEKNLEDYCATPALQKVVMDCLTSKTGDKKFTVTGKVVGGGTAAQAEALRHGIARALLKVDETLRGDLKKAGYLKRDPRMKERRKFGLKKARKAAQWSKR